ncbi:hypothetical protein K437DRAFT_86622 [Tilletiaria anomala UBC 951]|uniref:Uncharacterized protein n=1 Tax=Tilletiaria anomala (strain ATCC 24038 / CBS 436.72 / UBC 951) TaxID=1037660 RepID=A0A066W7G7_TILAU|nr:uncharacterized protein K437DRAFT_86622 [Tilletiaria anomala UBC 951]KDN48478.1 hypothetical protein K437DRAFT_86622 [Tilletiaria anomala UBC 951]
MHAAADQLPSRSMPTFSNKGLVGQFPTLLLLLPCRRCCCFCDGAKFPACLALAAHSPVLKQLKSGSARTIEESVQDAPFWHRASRKHSQGYSFPPGPCANPPDSPASHVCRYRVSFVGADMQIV